MQSHKPRVDLKKTNRKTVEMQSCIRNRYFFYIQFGWQVLRTCTYRLPGCRYIEACWAYSYCAPRHADNYKLYPSQSSMHMLRVLKGKESLKHLSTSMIKKLGCKNRVCPGTSRATSKIKKQFSRESSIHKKNALFIA